MLILSLAVVAATSLAVLSGLMDALTRNTIKVSSVPVYFLRRAV